MKYQIMQILKKEFPHLEFSITVLSSCCFSSAISISNLFICSLSSPHILTNVISWSVTARRESINCLLVSSNFSILSSKQKVIWSLDKFVIIIINLKNSIFVKMIDVERHADKFIQPKAQTSHIFCLSHHVTHVNTEKMFSHKKYNKIFKVLTSCFQRVDVISAQRAH